MSYLLIQGDARSIPLADKSVHMCVTSPPYWGLRDYATARWEGGDPGCDHRPPNAETGHIRNSTLEGGKATNAAQIGGYRDLCGKCGARRIDRQLGLEPSPEAYIANMVRVFREVKRILRDDGTCWINIGDTYNAYNGGAGPSSALSQGAQTTQRPKLATGYGLNCKSLKSKDLIGIPWRVALALQADGWWLRDAIVWAKAEVDDDDQLEGSAMPGSQRDRCTSAYELIFQLAKRERYYYDSEACKAKSGAMLRNVWRINPESWKGAHFATYPRELVRRAILLSTSEKGVCPQCGAPWEREVERTGGTIGMAWHDHQDDGIRGQRAIEASKGRGPNNTYRVSTLGWHSTCSHGLPPVPAVVFDPFIGSGTSIVVALALGRRAIGLDLSRDYLTGQAQRRIDRPHAAPRRPMREEFHPLFQ